MNEFDSQVGELVENIWQRFIELWADCQEPDYVGDCLNESLWDFIDELDLDLAFSIASSNPAKLDWGFFKDMYSDCSDWDGPYAVKNMALQLIWDVYLIPRMSAFKTKLLLEKPKPSENTKSDKQIWKGTLDPERIKQFE